MTSITGSSLVIRRATSRDAARLSEFAYAAFHDTFAADNRAEDMAAYSREAFGEAVQRREIEDPAVSMLLAERDGELTGYAMLRRGAPEPGVPGENPIELARLYAGQRWIGAGIGAALMQRCLADARAGGHDTIWLGVWERNHRAMAFYHRFGFADVGSHAFQLGSDRQTDRLMARRVEEDR